MSLIPVCRLISPDGRQFFAWYVWIQQLQDHPNILGFHARPRAFLGRGSQTLFGPRLTCWRSCYAHPFCWSVIAASRVSISLRLRGWRSLCPCSTLQPIGPVWAYLTSPRSPKRAIHRVSYRIRRYTLWRRLRWRFCKKHVFDKEKMLKFQRSSWHPPDQERPSNPVYLCCFPTSIPIYWRASISAFRAFVNIVSMETTLDLVSIEHLIT